MKFGRSIPLFLFFGFVFPTFINAEPKQCDVGGKCYWNGQISVDLLSGLKTKTCENGMCYAFKCVHSDGKIMHGSGCYEDFVSACGNIQSSIMENANRNKKFTYSDESVIVVSCGDEITDLSACAQHEFMTYTDDDKNGAFGLKHIKIGTMDPTMLKECNYNDKLIPPSKPQVQCAKGGMCLTGRIEGDDPPVVYSNVTCNACALFHCNVNGKIMTGSGCLNDFERICTSVPAAEMQKIKAGKKLYNYIDENNIVSSCAFMDNCNDFLFIDFLATVMDKFDRLRKPLVVNKGEICPYDPPPPPKPSEPKDNGSDGYKFSGMFALGLILFYLW
uniref:Uncharacterized protein n=1 Tax=Panagrolaimus davidi TaxID=227884 RepID=A0A914Q2L9_9BILA